MALKEATLLRQDLDKVGAKFCTQRQNFLVMGNDRCFITGQIIVIRRRLRLLGTSRLLLNEECNQALVAALPQELFTLEIMAKNFAIYTAKIFR